MDGVEFGRYRLIELLGRGGMGEVWRAHDTTIDRTVAIKMLLPHFAQDEKFEQRFRREARLAARLDDPHVVPIYDVGEIDARLYVAMRLIQGQDLQTMLEAGPLEPQRAVGIIGQIATALHAAHRAGLVHRDIKPSNILVAENDFAYLIDFGIARAAGETGLTSAGATIGTWSYMAPERFSTGEAEASSDIYALACVLYQCLTAQLPFPAVALEQIAVAHMTTPPPRPSVIRPEVPKGLDEVIGKGMAKDPEQRYAVAVEFANAAGEAITEPVPLKRNPNYLPASDPGQPAPTPNRASSPESRWSQLEMNPAAPAPAAPSISGPSRSPVAGPRLSDHPTQRLPPAPSSRSAVPPTKSRPDHIVQPLARAETTPAISPPQLARPEPAPASLAPPMPTSQPAERPNWRRRPVTISLAVATLLIIGVVVSALGLSHHDSAASPRQSAPSSATSPPQTPSPQGQSVLPFTDLRHPGGLSVGPDGAVYVADRPAEDTVRVQRLPEGANSAAAVPVPGVKSWSRFAVDAAGAFYFVDSGDRLNTRVLKVTPGAEAPVELPFGHLRRNGGLAVGADGTVYVAESWRTTENYNYSRILKLPNGATAPVEMPFADAAEVEHLAVSADGAVYVFDFRRMAHSPDLADRLVMLPANATRTVNLPMTNLDSYKTRDLAVGPDGTVYLSLIEPPRVQKLPPGADTPAEVPFTNLTQPGSVAVGPDGAVYVVDSDANNSGAKVLKLPRT